MENTKNYNLKKPVETDYYDVEDQNINMDIIDEALGNKVNKVVGKQLSTEDYTSSEKSKLSGIESGATGDQSANEVLNLLKSVDGNGSGIDADYLDGQHASEFSLNAHVHDEKYLNKLAKSVDSDKLDGKNSAEFASNNHNHNGIYESIINKKSGFNLDKSDSVTSSSSSILATLKAVKTVYDKAVSALSIANSKEPVISKKTGFNLNKSNSVSSSSSSDLATSTAVRTAYNKGVEALNKANTKLDNSYGDTLATSSSFTLNTGHRDRVICAGSSSNCVITVPINIFNNGHQVTIIRTGVGTVTFATADGVVLHSVDSKRDIKGLYASATIVFASVSVAYLIGSLE